MSIRAIWRPELLKNFSRIFAVCIWISLSAGIIFAQQPPTSEIMAELVRRIPPATGILIELDDGIVTLTGTVPNLAQKQSIVNLARRVIGVREVADRIVVVPTQKRTDEQIKEAVNRVFAGNLSREEIDAVNVRVENSVIFLTGTLSSSYPKQIAGVLSSWVPGVVGLRNEIVVRPTELRTDQAVQADVVKRYERNPFIPSRSISVSVNEGVVVLTGIVDNFLAAEQAETVAHFTPGVKGVHNLLFVRAMGT